MDVINRCSRLLLIFLLIGSFNGSMTLARAESLSLTLEAGDLHGSVKVNLKNVGTEPLSILNWETPFEHTLSSDVFRIERPIKSWPLVEVAEYIGREVKRTEPQSRNFLSLPPGETISTEVVLNEHYYIEHMDSYSVKYIGDIHYTDSAVPSDFDSESSKLAANDGLLDTEVFSDRMMIELSPRRSELFSPTPRIVPPSYSSCTVGQQENIVSASLVAEQLVDTAIFDLSNLADDERAFSPRYNTWFGSYSDNRFNRVVSQYQAIAQALAEETIRYDCGCTEFGVFAYVYPSRPYNIFLCPGFDAANIDGTDSRAGTIIHELSHFTILGGTDDHAYGQRAARALANTNPDSATANADNMEYFAENTPAIPILGGVSPTVPARAVQLELDTPITGELSHGESLVYEVSGAGSVSLVSLSGNADLVVYSDDVLSTVLCFSDTLSALDVCEVSHDGRIFIEVNGYTAATFTLEAMTETDIEAPEIELTELELDSPVFATLDFNEIAVYETEGATIVELDSLSGDADLYIFESLDFSASTLLCSSDLALSDATIDSCVVPADSGQIYVVVFGYTATDYSLLARYAPEVSPMRGPDRVNGFVFSRTDTTEFRWVLGTNNIWISGDCAASLGGAIQTGTWSDLNAIAPGFDQAADPCDGTLPPATVEGYVFSRTDTSEYRWVIGSNNIWISSECATSLGGPTQFGTWADLNTVSPGFDLANDPCEDNPPETGGETPPVVTGFVFSRTDTSEFRWVQGSNNIWISGECATSLGGATQMGNWGDLNEIAPGFDDAENPCDGSTPDHDGVDLPTTGYVFSRDDRDEFRWVIGTNNIWISESCAISLGGAALIGDWNDLNAIAPGFDLAENPCP